MKVLSLHRHLKSLDWQPVEPMAERAGLCCGGEVLALVLLFWKELACWGEESGGADMIEGGEEEGRAREREREGEDWEVQSRKLAQE